MRNARGKVRCGLTVSPALNVTYCQPSYAHSTLIIARPMPDNPDFICVLREFNSKAGYLPYLQRIAPKATMTITLIAVVILVRLALWRVPRMFTTVIERINTTATALATPRESGMNSPR